MPLAGIERHAHAQAVLGAAAEPGGRPSHAYLFHGPPGTGKREVARAFAAALLGKGAASPETVWERVQRESHPDLTWVRPSGAAEMLVGDVEQAVVAAATRTPFESARRVFVIEGAETMNEQAANRLLKTLEEPPPFAHLVLVSDRREDVIATVVSRCQAVRFDPLPAERIAAGLEQEGVEADTAAACARLALGDGRLAARLASGPGGELRRAAETLARSALSGATAERPWQAVLDAGRVAGAAAGERAEQQTAAELELLPAKERKRHEREGLEARRRLERRARTQTIDVGLRLTELWLRDLLCASTGAGELVHAIDRRAQLEEDAAGADAGAVGRAIELVSSTRLSLSLNVSEELALEAMAYRIGAS
ncbi:MAG: DNA polymerase III subunit [Solirubrobacteraceae bacterium]